jgi:subtilisin family serine protease
MKPPMRIGREITAPNRLPGRPSSAQSALPGDERRSPDQLATGQGVVVGVVDWGFDFAHPDFRYADGTTRLLALWDQSAPSGPGSPAPYGYGMVYMPGRINSALASRDPYGSLGYHPADSDLEGNGTHGTHVMGIAAGNGRAGGPAGMAPNADLVFVHLTAFEQAGAADLADSATLLEAVDFTQRVAGPRPWVVNLSMGQCGEQHDGTTLIEQGLDAALGASPGRAIVQSAGNYWASRLHSSGRLDPDERRVLRWRVPRGAAHEVEVWYSGSDSFIVELRTPSGELAGRAAPGERARLSAGGRRSGDLFHRIREPNNFDNHIVVTLYEGAPTGEWRLALVGRVVKDGRFHAWIQRDPLSEQAQSIFGSGDANPYFTTGSICNGRRTIAVGAYDAHKGGRPVAPFSSAGPTRDGRFKPDLLAPGVSVLSARSAPDEERAGSGLLVRQTGTSMAAPHVAGTVALMLEAARRPLQIDKIHELLLATTERTTAESPNVRCGNGYLDVEAAVRAAAGNAGARSYSPPPRFHGASESLCRDCAADATVRRHATRISAGIQSAPMPLLAYCDELIGMGGAYAMSPAALLARVLVDAAPAQAIDLLATHGLLDPATIFDGFATRRLGGLRPLLDPVFAVVALPRQFLSNAPRPGDILVRRALGEPGLGHVAFVAGPRAYARDDARSCGLRLETNRPGWYVQVVEAGPVPHRLAAAFGRLVANDRGQLAADTMLLRLRGSRSSARGVPLGLRPAAESNGDVQPRKLKAFRFRYDATLEAILNGSYQLRVASPSGPFDTGRYVKKVQQALIDAGYPLPQFGADGAYGPETAAAVSRFKTVQKLFPNDGVVGQKTMQTLDAIFVDEVPFPPPSPRPGDLALDDFIEAMQAAESANVSDTPEQFLTRWRQLYYPGTDPDGLTFREAAFDRLLPDAPLFLPNGSRRILTAAGMDPIFFGRLSKRAPENPTPAKPLDNPSPYLVDVTGQRVDIGHVLLTLDALLHPRAGDPPYQSFGVPAIDPASWVADLGIGAVWAEQDGEPGAPIKLPRRPDGQPDVDGYYRMSAPDSDLVGDIDGFNIIYAWLKGRPLSSALIAYYTDGETVPGGYRRRFRSFLGTQFGGGQLDAVQEAAAAAKWTPRVNRFNDLFAAGLFGSLAITPPPPRRWQFTPDVLSKFFQFLRSGLKTETDRFD